MCLEGFAFLSFLFIRAPLEALTFGISAAGIQTNKCIQDLSASRGGKTWQKMSPTAAADMKNARV